MKFFSIRGFVVTLVVLSSLPMSCTIENEDENEKGCSPHGGSFKVKQMELATKVLQKSSRDQFTLIESNVAQSDSMFFFVSVSESVVAKLGPKSNLSWGNQLFACSATAPYGKSILNSLNIYTSDTIKTTNKVFLPNQLINDLLIINDLDHREIDIDSFIQNTNRGVNTPYSFGVEKSEIQFKFNDSILPITNVQLRFEFLIDDIKEFNLETEFLTIR